MDIPKMKLFRLCLVLSLVAEAVSIDGGCADGQYGTFCHETCENCKTCEQGTGICTSCKFGKFGSKCRPCPVNCLDNRCDFRTGNCFECTFLYYGKQCNQKFPDKCGTFDRDSGRCLSCTNGYFGEKCDQKCPDNCELSSCDRDSGKCTKCPNGYYGDTCNLQCSNNCSGSSCDRDSGKCITCIIGKYGIFCNKTCSKKCQNKECGMTSGICSICVTGFYGYLCDHSCPSKCKETSCLRDHGNCTNGCIDNFKGDTCELCLQGKHGIDCDKKCPTNCLNGECIKYNGACKRGCNAGFSDTRFCCVNNTNCKSCSSSIVCAQCTNTSYGVDCEKACPVNCETTCNKTTGNCDKCKPNYYGQTCEFQCSDTCLITNDTLSRCSPQNGHCKLGCIEGFYGDKCERNCSEYCNISCDQKTGECGGCQLNRWGMFCEDTCSPNCVSHDDESVCNMSNGSCLQDCLTGFFGERCDHNCNIGCQDGQCNGSTGHCLLGCAASFTGPLCVKDTERETGFPTTIVGITVGGTVVMVIIVAIVIVVYRKRRSYQDKQNAEQTSKTNQDDNGTDTGYSVFYENKPRVEGTDAIDEDTFVPEVNQIDDKDEKTYYNFVSPRSQLGVKELYRFLSKSDENYQREFQMLPVGLIKPFYDAKLPQNARRNRYNMVYPYDDSRVKVKDFGNSDYINASYIDGYKTKNAYIACLGPTKDTLGDFSLFWKMIWQEKVEVIVMVTKLKEASGMKCDQYWPNAGKTVKYGQMKVTNTGEEEYAEFIVRNMIVSMDNEERQFHHIHFTAWPDKGVPSDVISIVNLRNKVSRMRRKFDGPLVVHCSAGIGRTGTYIALDILIRHGLADQSVDVLGCIRNIRQQRVHMVQTVEQYKYLHHAVLWSLSIDTEPVPSDRFNDLSWVFKEDGLDKMLKQLKMENWYDTVEEKRAVGENTNKSFVNRRNADIPGCRHEVKMLPRDRKAPIKTEYINAVFIDPVSSFDDVWSHLKQTRNYSNPSLQRHPTGYTNCVRCSEGVVIGRRRNRFIAAQTPLPETVPTFLDMVVQRQVRCIIDLEPNSNQDDVGEYLPDDNDELQNGNVVFKSCNKKDLGPWVKRDLEYVTDKQVQDKTTITHYQFTKWPRSDVIPDSVQFIKLIHEVDRLVIQTGQSGPILIHCMNGAERCALFCAMWLLIERIGADNSVSVLNTLRQVKSRRRKSIPNKEQIEFCFKGIVTHLNQLNLNVYSNT